MAQRIQFNTGRKYTAAGQRIVAIRHDDNVVTFMDHDRMIGGEFVTTLPTDVPLTESCVMRFYDNNKYRMSSRALSSEHAWIED